MNNQWISLIKDQVTFLGLRKEEVTIMAEEKILCHQCGKDLV